MCERVFLNLCVDFLAIRLNFQASAVLAVGTDVGKMRTGYAGLCVFQCVVNEQPEWHTKRHQRWRQFLARHPSVRAIIGKGETAVAHQQRRTGWIGMCWRLEWSF